MNQTKTTLFISLPNPLELLSKASTLFSFLALHFVSFIIYFPINQLNTSHFFFYSWSRFFRSLLLLFLSQSSIKSKLYVGEFDFLLELKNFFAVLCLGEKYESYRSVPNHLINIILSIFGFQVVFIKDIIVFLTVLIN